MDNGRCQQVNPYCKEYDPSNGDCTGCYPGYVLSRGRCIIPEAEEVDEDGDGPADPPQGVDVHDVGVDADEEQEVEQEEGDGSVLLNDGPGTGG